MKIKLCTFTSLLALLKRLSSSKEGSSIVYALTFIIGVSCSSAFAGRFDPPSLQLQLNSFDDRLEGNIFNVDFLLAHIINSTRKTVRESNEIVDRAEQVSEDTTAIFTNSTQNNVGATAGSVIIPPGTKADTIIIINQIEGDSIAIQR